MVVPMRDVLATPVGVSVCHLAFIVVKKVLTSLKNRFLDDEMSLRHTFSYICPLAIPEPFAYKAGIQFTGSSFVISYERFE